MTTLREKLAAPQAATTLGELYDDLTLFRGHDDKLTQEVAEALDRLATSAPPHDGGEQS